MPPRVALFDSGVGGRAIVLVGSRGVVLASVIGLAGWLFASALVGGEVCAYRDAGHFYYPLFQLVRDYWDAGRAPLWNPYENCGVPLLASGTASAFYPGQLLFQFPLAYAWAFNAYLVLHVLLAAAGAYRLARHWQTDVAGAGLAALSYAFGGCVLFQYCNVVFLVGAAWLPWAIGAIDRVVRQGSFRAAVGLGLCLALMTLGGDPQLAYHTMLLAGLYLLVRRWGVPIAEVRPVRAWHSLAALGLASIVGLGLSAVQVGPSLEFSQRSDRAAFVLPRSILELPGYMARADRPPRDSVDRLPWYAGMIGSFDAPGSHERAIYRYSVPPWRLTEWIWPNVAGKSFPINRRWTTALPAETGVWVPSMYAGLLPAVLAIAGFRLRRTSAAQRWMSWTLVVALLASFGAYGPAWLTREVLSALGWMPAAGDPAAGDSFRLLDGVGGLYWFFNVLLPGYVQFRYPAKWLVVAALAVSMLSGFGWQAWTRGECRPTTVALSIAIGLSVCALVLAVALRGHWDGWLAAAPSDRLFGPLDTRGAWYGLLQSLAHTLIVAALLVFILRPGSSGRASRWAMAAVVVTVVDLAVAQGWMVATVPRSIMNKTSLATTPRAPQEPLADRTVGRMDRCGYWANPAWSESSDPHRLHEIVGWQRDTFWPRYPLTDRLGLAVVAGTMMPLDYRAVLDVVERDQRNARRGAFWNVFSVRTLLMPTAEADQLVAANPTLQPLATFAPPGSPPGSVRMLHNSAAYPRAWLADEIVRYEPIDETNPAEVWSRTSEVFQRLQSGDDSRRLAVVESLDPLKPPPEPVRNDLRSQDLCLIVRDEPHRVDVTVRLDAPRLLVLADSYDPGWNAILSSRQLPIWRTNRTQRGVWLPAGEHRVQFRYQPASYRWGLACSAATCGLLIVGSSVRVIRSRRRRA